jgi:hypothetical protein
MRFFVAVMAAILAVGLNGAAQDVKSHGGKRAAQSEPKSTVPAKAAGAKTSGTSSKQLQKIEHQKVSKGEHTKKTHARVVKTTKDSRNSGINFNNSGGKGTGLNAHNGGSLKGRLKQKGKGKKN